MPVITIQIRELDKDKKAAIAKSFTEELSNITGIEKGAITILFQELSFDNIATAGVLKSNKP